MRMHAQTAVIENGFVHIPETARDQGDSIERFLDWFKTPFARQGIYEYYRRQHAAAEQRRKPLVKRFGDGIGENPCIVGGILLLAEGSLKRRSVPPGRRFFVAPARRQGLCRVIPRAIYFIRSSAVAGAR